MNWLFNPPHWLAELREWAMLLFEFAIVWILIVEFYYDKMVIESRKRPRRRTKNKVKVEIDHDGQAHIIEQPKDIDIQIVHKGDD